MFFSLRQLEIFVAVVETKGFSAAGERLHMVQPAVSIAVRKLESASGVQLLNRTNQGVVTTREGAAFLTHARTILNQVESLDRQLSNMQSLASGHINIAAPPVMGTFIVPPIIGAFVQRHPGIRINYIEREGREIAAKVASGEIDIGFMQASEIDDGMDVVLLERMPLVCMVSEKSPLAQLTEVTWEQVLDQPLLVLPPGYSQRVSLDEACQRLQRRPNIIVEGQSLRMLLELTRLNCGVTLEFAELPPAMLDGIVSLAIVGGPTTGIFLCRQSRGGNVAATTFFEEARERAAAIQ